jgi:hypothetical protein
MGQDLLSLGLKLFFAYQKIKSAQKTNIPQQTGQTYQTVTSKDTALNEIKQKAGSVTVIIGTRETGKSNLSYRWAEFLGRPTFCVSPQEQTPKWIRRINFPDILEIVPENATLILDDLPAYAGNRDYNDEMVRILNRIIPMVRHDRQPPEFPVGKVHLIFNTQSSAAADRFILDCDAAFFKPVGLLIEERPNVARIYKQFVNAEFEGKDSLWIKQHAYLMTPTWRGIIQIGQTKK